jgi:large subunit ribosomal protein L32
MASVKTPSVQRCPKCEAPKASHRVCMECGYYAGREIVEIKQPDAE